MLPKIQHPTFSLKLPSNGQEVIYRPFLVKEEKILLIAQESKEEKDIIRAIKQILQNCCVTDVDIGNIALFDIEYFFLKLRAKSVNNLVTLKFKDKEDNRPYEFDVDLDSLEPTGEPLSPKIQVTDDIGLELRYPSINILNEVSSIKDPVEQFNALVGKCIKTIWDADNVYDVALEPAEDVANFINSLSTKQFEKIKEFFDSAPKIKHEIKYKNSLDHDRKIVLEGLTDFFQ